MTRRLATVGVAAINNVVDITNYVLLECGQPLHAFDLAKLDDRRIVVREPLPGETIEAIDHKTYQLAAGMCVIADARRAVAIGGVMGGSGSEVTLRTCDLLIESAEFDPLTIRNTARRLNLHSDSSYRFERGVDPQGVDWSSRRACELILELGGGELAAGVIDVGRTPPKREPIVLRLSQFKRILGIDIPAVCVREILAALGNREQSADERRIEVVPPSWRADVSREIDLVEEVARIHGYDAIPEDVSVPMATSARTGEDRVLSRVRHALSAAGFDEAMTASLVEEDLSSAFSPWTSAAPLVSHMPLLRRADRLRRSLVPSLLSARHTNEALSNPVIELFEIAAVYLPRANELPDEQLMLAITSGGDFYSVKGALEAVVAELNPRIELEAADTSVELLDARRCCQLRFDGELWGYLGEVSSEGLKKFDLRSRTTVAEVKVSLLSHVADLVRLWQPQPAYPAIARDLNFVVEEQVRWTDIAAAVRTSGGERLENLEYKDTYRDETRLGAGKKSVLLSITLRAHETTLTSHEADAIRDRIVAACAERLGAQLRT
jgi:phenylalanyl-tRNA synthetase beta chain